MSSQSANTRIVTVVLVAALYAATVLVFGSLAGWAGATARTAANEAEYRDALTDLSGDSSGPHVITITADFSITDPLSEGDPTYSGDQALTIDGGGHTVTGDGSGRFLDHNSTADLEIRNVTVTDFFSGGGGGGVDAAGDVTIRTSTFSGNGGGADPGGAVRAIGQTITVIGSTFEGNSAADGGALAGDVIAINSTFTDNTASSQGGAIWGGSVDLTYVTLSGNSAPTGANIFLDEINSFGSVVVDPQGGGSNCATSNGLIAGTKYSYSTDASCGFTDPSDTSNGPDPQLGPLADNGGPTQTMHPQTGSPLIDAIPPADCHDEVTTDQRGVTRPQDGDDNGTLRCDIGAVEVEGAVEPAEPVEGQPDFTG